MKPGYQGYSSSSSLLKAGANIYEAVSVKREGPHNVNVKYEQEALQFPVVQYNNNDDETEDDDETDIVHNNGNATQAAEADLAEEDHPANFTLSAEQDSAARNVLQGKKSVFLTGAAGTGKSYLLRYIISRIRTKRRRNGLFVTATTGVAAENIRGTTVHSFAGIGLGNAPTEELCKIVMSRPPAVSRWRDAKYLVIDEVSMLHAELFNKLEYIARKVRGNERPFGGIQLILCGDFFQLPPVERRGKDVARYAFQSPVWETCGIQTITLQQVQRQSDNKFITLLNEIRLGQLSERSSRQLEACHVEVKALPDDGILPTRLYCLNRNVDAENQLHLDRLPGEDRVYIGSDQWEPRKTDFDAGGEDSYRQETIKQPGTGRTKADIVEDLDRKCPLRIRLRVGAQVMYTKNDPSRNLVNGSRGVVTACGAGPAKVRFDNKQQLEIMIERTAQSCRHGRLIRNYFPLKLAWAMTVHKSQGMTLTRAELQLDNAFEVGQVYVALSRVKSLEGLYLRGGRITAALVRVDTEVLNRFGGNADALPPPMAGIKADPAGGAYVRKPEEEGVRDRHHHDDEDRGAAKRVKAEQGAAAAFHPFGSIAPPSVRKQAAAVVDLITPDAAPLPKQLKEDPHRVTDDPFARLVATHHRPVPGIAALDQSRDTIDLCSPVKAQRAPPAIAAQVGGPVMSAAARAALPARKDGQQHLQSKAILYFDGGSLGNPGVGGAGYSLFTDSSIPPHLSGYAGSLCLAQAAVRMDGVCTNNQAEYVGLIHGMHTAQRLGVRELSVFGDSELVVKQMSGEYKVKNAVLQGMHARATALAAKFSSVRYAWIERGKNTRADELSKRAMLQRASAEEAADWFKPS